MELPAPRIRNAVYKVEGVERVIKCKDYPNGPNCAKAAIQPFLDRQQSEDVVSELCR